jgi:hypothetical protein
MGHSGAVLSDSDYLMLGMYILIPWVIGIAVVVLLTVMLNPFAKKPVVQLRALSPDEEVQNMAIPHECPNCAKLLPSNSLKCDHCQAVFGQNSAWSPRPRSSRSVG